MDVNFLTEALVPVVVGICVCLGYVLKNSIPSLDNRYIPSILAVVGLVLNIWVAKTISPDVVLGGLISGLSATGLYEAFRNLINKGSGE